MDSTSNDKEKMPSEDDRQDLEPKEGVESEAEKEEIEEEQRSFLRAVITSIGVVTNASKFKRSSWISTGGGVSHHTLAPQTSPPGNNHFHTLIHEHQFQKVPRSRLPSGWDIDHSNSAGKESSKSEEGWGNNSKSWDS
jgi:hypothetical protein